MCHDLNPLIMDACRVPYRRAIPLSRPKLIAEGVCGRAASRHPPLDLIKPPIVKENRSINLAAVHPIDAGLPTNDPTRAMGNIDFYLTLSREHQYRIGHDVAFRHLGMRQISNRDLELGVLLHNGIDARFDQAAAGGLVRRGFDLGLGGKGDRKALLRIFVFPPALRTGWGACGYYGDDEGDEAHFDVLRRDRQLAAANMVRSCPDDWKQGDRRRQNNDDCRSSFLDFFTRLAGALICASASPAQWA